MKKIISLILAAVMCMAVFTGCGNKASDKDEQGRTIISVGNWPEQEEQIKSMNERKANFEKANTDVVIEEDAWRFERKTFFTKAAGGQLPTYFNAGFTEVAGIIESGYAADLTDAMKKHGFYDNMNKQILDIVSTDDGIYALPERAYVLGLVFNTELMEKAGLLEADGTPKQPKDWYELAEFAVKIREATGTPGFVFPTSGNNGGWIFNPVAWSFGVDFMEQDKDGNWKATFDSQECIDALQFIKDLKWKYDVLPANTLIDGTEYYKVFASGNAGMMIAAGDFTNRITKYGMTPDQAGIMAIPAGPKRHVTLLGGSVDAVADNATADQIDAAVRWHSTVYNYKLTDDVKKNFENEINSKLSDGQLVGVESISIWDNASESLVYERQLIKEKANCNLNHVRLYNEFVENCPAELQAEEAVCAQELYGILDSCIQKVLMDKDADCAELIKKAAKDFQADYLDKLTY